MMQEKLLTPDDVAETLGVGRGCLAKWRLSGFGPKYLKIGRRVAYQAEDVAAWLSDRRRQSTSDVPAGAGGR